MKRQPSVLVSVLVLNLTATAAHAEMAGYGWSDDAVYTVSGKVYSLTTSYGWTDFFNETENGRLYSDVVLDDASMECLYYRRCTAAISSMVVDWQLDGKYIGSAYIEGYASTVWFNASGAATLESLEISSVEIELVDGTVGQTNSVKLGQWAKDAFVLPLYSNGELVSYIELGWSEYPLTEDPELFADGFALFNQIVR